MDIEHTLRNDMIEKLNAYNEAFSKLLDFYHGPVTDLQLKLF